MVGGWWGLVNENLSLFITSLLDAKRVIHDFKIKLPIIMFFIISELRNPFKVRFQVNNCTAILINH